MKTGAANAEGLTAPIVALVDERPDAAAEQAQLVRARSFAEPLLRGQVLDTGEEALAHADAVAAVLLSIGAAPSMRAAAYLVYAADYLNKPEEVVSKAFGPSYGSLVMGTRQLMHLQRAARNAQLGADQRVQQSERVRKMLLAFSRDLRVVLLRLASRLQTLRFFAASKQPCPFAVATESMQVFAPLASRLGIWQIKWELEDLAFRFLEPQRYRQIAQLLDETRIEREQRVEALRQYLSDELQTQGLQQAQVQGRPKHLYSIWKKMQGKNLDFTGVHDMSAVRVIVPNVAQCYAVLGCVHGLFKAVPDQLNDYIERPKPNGYQSLHTVVLDAQGRALEVQIRTPEMHQHAEHGVAAHWVYKDVGTPGYAAVRADAALHATVAQARKTVLNQLLAWERDYAQQDQHQHQDSQKTGEPRAALDEHIYVFTPGATVVELVAGATPIDFAYAVHTELGHRCRGAKVDGALVPLNTALRSGQTVEVNAAKEGGPSLDWLNQELGYLRSPRSRSKVRAWHNALAQRATISRGREAVTKLLQREGKTAMKLDDLAARLGFRHADALFEVVGKEEFSLRNIELLLRPIESLPADHEQLPMPRRSSAFGGGVSGAGGVLVVGVGSLMTSLARCCRPAPPDDIGGYITRGKGVAVHRAGCPNFRHMTQRAPERSISVAWGATHPHKAALYPVDVKVQASRRHHLVRDISECFSKEKINVIGVRTEPVSNALHTTATLTFTVEVPDSAHLAQVLSRVGGLLGVQWARRNPS
jgi:GTP pyrophosphokinase